MVLNNLPELGLEIQYSVKIWIAMLLFISLCFLIPLQEERFCW